ncbi:MAG: CPBP family glutamic-type intramembrane protease [Senegalia sp. (in: firmicutes)]|uniref:CPBP family glutamic-type intramembrane protease n=1 Tax=Senegalia sp. (in: firmicutes) TaxID=1924098 RepID=UPI003F95D18F
MDKFMKRPKVLEVNIFYFFIAILLVTIGNIAQSYELFSGLLITEYILVLLPVIIFLKVKGYSIKKVLRLNKIKFKDILLVIFITILLYPVAAFVNSIMLIIVSLFGELKPTPIPTPSSASFYLLGLFVIAITPGICEEIMFRGLIMSGYSSKGYKKAIFISAFLFGIFHFNIQNLLGPIFLGIVFGFIVYRTNSLIAGMIAHATNNALAWSLTYMLSNIENQAANMENIDIAMSETLQLTMASFTLFGISFFSGAIALYLYKKLPKYNEVEIEYDDSIVEDNKNIFKYIPIIITIIGFIILNFLAYI